MLFRVAHFSSHGPVKKTELNYRRRCFVLKNLYLCSPKNLKFGENITEYHD